MFRSEMMLLEEPMMTGSVMSMTASVVETAIMTFCTTCPTADGGVPFSTGLVVHGTASSPNVTVHFS